MAHYTAPIEQAIRNFYARLAEKDKRHYAALEAQKLGYGGKRYIGALLHISQRTLRKAQDELTQPELMGQIPPGRQRRIGGGRKKKKSNKPTVSLS
jgi:hypothetical protein